MCFVRMIGPIFLFVRGQTHSSLDDGAFFSAGLFVAADLSAERSRCRYDHLLRLHFPLVSPLQHLKRHTGPSCAQKQKCVQQGLCCCARSPGIPISVPKCTHSRLTKLILENKTPEQTKTTRGTNSVRLFAKFVHLQAQKVNVYSKSVDMSSF